SRLQGVRARVARGGGEGQAAREDAAEHQGPAVIALIDYKAGNLTSVRKAFAALGGELFTPERPEELASADAIVVPGVGHFGATRALGPDWIEAILARVGEGRPLLGICLGMQWLFEGSEEAPDLPGLGLLGGQCYRLGAGHVRLTPHVTPPGTPDVTTIKVPHVGWNALDIRRDAPIVDGVANGSQVYFTHSFVAP